MLFLILRKQNFRKIRRSGSRAFSAIQEWSGDKEEGKRQEKAKEVPGSRITR